MYLVYVSVKTFLSSLQSLFGNVQWCKSSFLQNYVLFVLVYYITFHLGIILPFFASAFSLNLEDGKFN